MQVLEVDIPKKLSTNSIYAGIHWSERKKHKDLFLWSMIGMKKLNYVNKCELEFDFEFKGKPLDASNCSYLVKLCEDCLVHYKIIPDDNYNIVKSIKMTSNKGKQDKVKITIKEIKEC